MTLVERFLVIVSCDTLLAYDSRGHACAPMQCCGVSFMLLVHATQTWRRRHSSSSSTSSVRHRSTKDERVAMRRRCNTAS